MSRDLNRELEARIREMILRRLRGTTRGQKEITMDTPILGKGLGLDSVEALVLITEIEAEFDIGFDDEELTVNLFKNIGTLAEFVRNKLSREQKQARKEEEAR
jgi:acyl carrier protein